MTNRATAIGKHPTTIVRQETPFNGGAPLEILCNQYITPNEFFFVRNHGEIPKVQLDQYKLSVSGLIENSLQLSLDYIKKHFSKCEITATLQCAGNRREELISVKPVPGELGWGLEAISNATWIGAPLKEILIAAGIKQEAKHVVFTGLDEVTRQERTFGFGGSIPLEKALSSEVLLAYEMNGEPLTPVHGFPLRVVVPGYIGARSVKWLSEIILQEEPSANYFQSHAYKLFPPNMDAQTVDWSKGIMLGEMSVNSVICTPSEGQTLHSGLITIGGYAFVGGGRIIERIDLSIDGGKNWVLVDNFNKKEDDWAWCLWKMNIELSKGKHQLVVRAWDNATNTQPENIQSVWNFKGYMNNAWHRVNIICT